MMHDYKKFRAPRNRETVNTEDNCEHEDLLRGRSNSGRIGLTADHAEDMPCLYPFSTAWKPLRRR